MDANDTSTSPSLYLSNLPPKARLLGSHDLLSLFKLNHLYDQYVRPYMHDSSNPASALSQPKEFDSSFANYVSELPGKQHMRSSRFFFDLCSPGQTNTPIQALPHDAMTLAFTLRPGPVYSVDKEVLGLEEDKQALNVEPQTEVSEKRKKKKRAREDIDDGNKKKIKKFR